MPTIAAFRGILYDQSKVDIRAVVAPPYDVISDDQQDELYARNPYNVVRLILGREQDRYASAAEYFKRWQDEGILSRDPKPAIYVLRQSFRVDDRVVERRGFIALCRLEEFEKGLIVPHEETLSGPKEDRLKLFKSTKANFSQIFALYDDPEKKLEPCLDAAAREVPFVDVDFEGVNNKLRKLLGRDAIQLITDEMKGKQVLIADGHHRYETGLAYRDWMRDQNPSYTGHEPYNYIMMFFTNMRNEGLVILPTHRLVRNLPNFNYSTFMEGLQKFFDIEFAGDREAALAKLRASGHHAFIIAVKGEARLILARLKNETLLDEVVGKDLPREVGQLDVTLLHCCVLRQVLAMNDEVQKLNLEYVKDATDAFDAIREGRAQVAFVINPTKIEEVRTVAQAGLTMPQKSSYFYPKLLSGLVMNSLEHA